jgi:hypothetical protein
MKTLQYKGQSGFALLIFLLALMGLGGIALAGFSQNALRAVEDSRFEHNREVLQEAKQALLMGAYNYPQFSVPLDGPGRLPCPDTDNDGFAEATAALCDLVGRFPWREPNLNFYNAMDASGENLWYAVSEEFRENAPTDGILNPESGVNKQNITLIDQTGVTIYDGAVNGIAAVVIGPGPAMTRVND